MTWLKQAEIRRQSFATFRQISIVLVITLYLILIPETVASLAGQLCGGEAVSIGARGIGTRIEQQSHHRQVAAAAGKLQLRGASVDIGDGRASTLIGPVACQGRTGQQQGQREGDLPEHELLHDGLG